MISLPPLGKKILLQAFEPRHAAAVSRWYYDFRYASYFRSFEDMPYTEEDCKNIMLQQQQAGMESYVIEDQNSRETMGITMCQCTVKRAGVYRWGILLDAKFQAQNLTIDVLATMGFYLFDEKKCQKLYVSTLSSDCHIGRILQEAGFELEGRLKEEAVFAGNYLDEVRYCLFKASFYQLYGKFKNS